MLLIFAILTSCALWAQDYVSGVSTEAISLPAAPGSVEGLPATINESGNKGQFRYSIEIKIPKGVNGLQPQLNLSYNSQAGQSEFGLGWSLDIATIERSTKKGVPTYSETDNFWGPDGELLKIDRLGDGTQFYAPYISKVQNLYEYDATTNTWVLHRIDGSKLYFGENLADSSIQTELGVFRWFIEKQVDSIGNEITYSYNKISGHPVLEAISYAYKTGTPFYQVKFQYENRPDPIISYKSNERITQTKRCTEIRVESPGNHIIRSYEFNYAPLAPGLGSTLVSIQQRGVAGADADSAMPPLEFDYSKIDLEADFKTIKLDFADSEIFPPSLNKNRATIVDIDRDSFPDLIETSRFGMKVWLNDRANGFLPHYKVESFI